MIVDHIVINQSTNLDADHDVRPGHTRLPGAGRRGQHARGDGDRANVGGAAAVAPDAGDDAAGEVGGLGRGNLGLRDGRGHDDGGADGGEVVEREKRRRERERMEGVLSLFLSFSPELLKF